MSGFLALMNVGEGDIEKLRGAIENCDGSAESMAETMQDNLNGQLTILKSQLEELAIAFGVLLMPTIRKIVSAVQAFVDKLSSMDDSIRETILKVSGGFHSTGNCHRYADRIVRCFFQPLLRQLERSMGGSQGHFLRYLGWHQVHLLYGSGHLERCGRYVPRLVRHGLEFCLGEHQGIL